jgi:hypothetical protein
MQMVCLLKEINNADFLPSASGLDYSDSGIVDNSSREYASKLADASQDIFGMDIDNKEAMRWIRATNVKAPDQGHPEGTVRY